MEEDLIKFTEEGIDKATDIMKKVYSGYELDEEEIILLALFFICNPDIEDGIDDDYVCAVIRKAQKYLVEEGIAEE